MSKYKNLHGTSDRNPPNGYISWKEYVIGKLGYWPSTCSCIGCNSVPTVGAHVIKVDSYDRRWYIAPLCSYHNNQFGEQLNLYDNYVVLENDR